VTGILTEEDRDTNFDGIAKVAALQWRRRARVTR
jgi:hypothetical protein